MLGQSAEFSLNCNICFFYKRDSGATPVFIFIFIYIYIIILFSILVLLFFTYLLINLTNQASINISIFHITNIIAIYHKPLTHCIFTASIDIALHMTQEYLVEYVEMRLHMKIAQSNVIYVISGNILTA